MERINLLVDDGVGELLTAIAGGERKRGRWLTDAVRAASENQMEIIGSELETMRFAMNGMAGQLKAHEARLLDLERQLAALIAQRA